MTGSDQLPIEPPDEARPYPSPRPWLGAISALGSVKFLSAGAALLANVLAARHLGPENYGFFAVLFSMMTVMATLTGPGLDTCLVRFAARHITPQADPKNTSP